MKSLVDIWENELKNNYYQDHTDNSLVIDFENSKSNDSDLYEKFYKNLTFGTAGMRGIMGAGPNRMNIYTVRRATQGLANYLKHNFNKQNLKVAISYDSRINSYEFAKESACVLAGNKIKVYLTQRLQPTPTLSFLVRKYECDAGIMITASHNSAKYNGYKCYGRDGGQMTDESAAKVASEMELIDMFKDVKFCSLKKALEDGFINLNINEEYYIEHIKCAVNQCINLNVFDDSDLSVVYSPLNGTGLEPIKKLFEKLQIKKVFIVPEQEHPDGNFSTCNYPNPEEKEALDLSIKLAKKVNADIVLATDPDCDRVGIAVKTNNGYSLLSGNVVGVLLTNYLLSQKYEKKTLPKDPIVIRTIVSTPLVDLIAKKFGGRVVSVLTGFKYIGEQILKLEQKGLEENFVFGFEESSGFLSGTYVRDKDAIVASALICEMTAYYKRKGKNLVDVIEEIYKEFGFYKNVTVGFTFEGSSGEIKIKNLMEHLRKDGPDSFADLKIEKTIDYLFENNTGLPKSNVLVYVLENQNLIVVRPSGTEPKIKIYVTAVSDSKENSEILSQKIIEDIKVKLGLI